jgi:hypothetical protein
VGSKSSISSRLQAQGLHAHRDCGHALLHGHSGSNKVVFQGRISRSQRLKPGVYTLVITATNPAGQRSAPASLRFTIVR